VDGNGATALHTAAECGCLEAVNKLTAHEAELKKLKPDKDGQTPFDRAIFGGHVQITSLLLSSNGTIDRRVLTSAASLGHVEVIELLARKGIKPQPLIEGDTLKKAIESGHRDCTPPPRQLDWSHYFLFGVRH
jgi:ankyrin repeat protein